MTARDEPVEGITATSGRLRLALLVALLAAGATVYATGLYRCLDWNTWRDSIDAWRGHAARNLFAAAVVFFAAYVAVSLLSLPVSGAMSILCGALFDRWLGTGLASLSATAGAALAFLVSRHLLGDWVRRRFARWLPAIDRGVRRDGAFYLFTLRLTPAPFCLVNLGMALTPMRLGTFVLVSWLGLLPVCFFYANAGSELARIEHPAEALSAPVVASLALLGLTPLLARLLLRRLCGE